MQKLAQAMLSKQTSGLEESRIVHSKAGEVKESGFSKLQQQQKKKKKNLRARSSALGNHSFLCSETLRVKLLKPFCFHVTSRDTGILGQEKLIGSASAGVYLYFVLDGGNYCDLFLKGNVGPL